MDWNLTNEEAPRCPWDPFAIGQNRQDNLLAGGSARATHARAVVPGRHRFDSVRPGLHVVETGLVGLLGRQLGLQQVVFQSAEKVGAAGGWRKENRTQLIAHAVDDAGQCRR